MQLLRAFHLASAILFFVAGLSAFAQTEAAPPAAPAPAAPQPEMRPRDLRPSSDLPSRTLRIDLERVPGVPKYEVEIKPKKSQWLANHKLLIKCCTLRVRVTPGIYQVRTRFYPGGDWGAWTDFTVHYKPPENIVPKNESKLKPVSDHDEKMVFEWPAARGAKYYYFELQDSSGKIIKQDVVSKNFLDTMVPVAQKYKWALLPMSAKDEDVSKAAKTYWSFEILPPDAKTRPAIIVLDSLDKEKDVARYEYEFVKFVNDQETTEPVTIDSKLPEFRLRMNPGAYELRVRSVREDGTKSFWSAPSKFEIPLYKVNIKSPSKDGVIEATHASKARVPIRWARMNGAVRYIVTVFDSNGKIIAKKETKDLKADVGVKAGESYGLHVQAYSFGEDEKEPDYKQVMMNFKVDQFIEDHYNPTVEEPTHLYAWGSYLVTFLDYMSENRDNNAKTVNPLPGGSGEVALGYWHRKSRYGLLGFIDYSGFTMSGQNYTYMANGFLFGRRFLLTDNIHARLWGGYGQREIPEMITHPLTDFLEVNMIRTQGAILELSLLGPIHEKLSWYFFGRYYQSFGGGGTPNGLALESMKSTQYGLYLSRPLGKSFKGRVGYSYRDDMVTYGSTIGGSNMVDIKGYYLSLALEAALQAPDEAD